MHLERDLAGTLSEFLEERRMDTCLVTNTNVPGEFVVCRLVGEVCISVHIVVIT